LRQVEEVGHEASTIAILLGIDVDELKGAIEGAKKINSKVDELKPFEEIEKRARREHTRMGALEKAQKMVDVSDPFKMNVMEVRQALADALAAEVPQPALAEAEAKMHWAEAAQANKNILDVVDAIKEPQTMLTVNSDQLRALLNTVAKKPEAAEAFEALQAQLVQVELVQSTVAALEALGFAEGGILKVKSAQLRIALDTARADKVPEVLLEKYVDRYAEAAEAQKLLDHAHQLEMDLKTAKDSGDGEAEIALQKDLDAVRMSIAVLEEL